MPTISAFYGILIRILGGSCSRPFHAVYEEHEALINILTLETIRGSLPRRAMALVLEWAEAYHDELVEDWELCRQNQPAKMIEALK